MTSLRIQSLNIRGGRNLGKRLAIFNYLKRYNADFIFLQECHVLPEDLQLWKADWGVGNIYVNPLSSRSAGQAILTKDRIEVLEHKIIIEGRMHILKIKVLEIIISLVNIYGPNHESERGPFIVKLQDVLNTYDFGDHIIIGGDFNLVLNDKLDKMSRKENLQKKKPSESQNRLKNIIENYNLVDIWRDKNNEKRMYTWSQPNPLVRCRLDYFLTSSNMVRHVKNVKILPSIKTDHNIIDLTFKVDGPKRGPGFWKLNTTILQEESYIFEMKSLIEKVWENTSDIENLNTRYDWLKYNIRKFTIEYCKQRAKIKKG